MFLLNGRPLYLRGTNIQGLNALWYWSERDRLIDTVLMLKAGNFNAVRFCQHVCFPEVRELLDRLGMMSEQDQGSGGAPVYPEQLAQLPSTGTALARACYNNPGVVLLSFANETTLDPAETIAAVLAVDPERILKPISGGSCSRPIPNVYWANVVHDIHDYSGWYADMGRIEKLSKPRAPGRLITVGEYGAEALDGYETMLNYPAHWPKTPPADADTLVGQVQVQKTDARQIIGFRGQRPWGAISEQWYRRPTNLGQYIEASQNYQADLLAEYTKGLRLSPRAIGGYFQFHFVDVMPANWPKSIVSHDLRPKKAYYEMAQVNQPLVPLFQLLDRGKAMELWVANDLPERFDHCRLQWSVKLGKPLVHGEKVVDVPAADAVMVERVDISSVPANLQELITIELALNNASGKMLSRYQREIFLKAWRDPEYVTKQTLCAYFDAMSAPKPFVVRSGKAFQTHRDEIRRHVMECLSLSPLPERVLLDAHRGEPLDHPWCTVRRVTYQIWPNVYTDALLYMPKHFIDRPAPAILSTCGHWPDGVAYQDEQRRALNFTRLGYVVLGPCKIITRI